MNEITQTKNALDYVGGFEEYQRTIYEKGILPRLQDLNPGTINWMESVIEWDEPGKRPVGGLRGLLNRRNHLLSGEIQVLERGFDFCAEDLFDIELSQEDAQYWKDRPLYTGDDAEYNLLSRMAQESDRIVRISRAIGYMEKGVKEVRDGLSKLKTMLYGGQAEPDSIEQELAALGEEGSRKLLLDLLGDRSQPPDERDDGRDARVD